MPTDPKTAMSSNSPKAEPDFIIHGKAIDRLAWRIPALL
jgi:hypothetical protein